MGKKLRGATKTTLTLRQGLPQVPLTNIGEQLLDRPLRGLSGARAAGDCRPYHWVEAGRTAEDCGPYHWLVCDGRQGTAALAIGLEGGGGPQGTAVPTFGGRGGGVRSEWRNVREAFVVPRSLLIVSRMGTGILSRRNGHPVSPERRCRCAGTATPLRRNGHPVVPERRCRCAGTGILSRRNGDAVAPERRCRCAGTATPLRRNGRAVQKEGDPLPDLNLLYIRREGVGSWKDDGGGWGRRGLLLGGLAHPFLSLPQPNLLLFAFALHASERPVRVSRDRIHFPRNYANRKRMVF